jgi:2'-5' RNA ligase superfamily
MGRTALIVAVPEAEAAVADIRLQYVASAALGVPAHVTVLAPFVDGDEIDEEELAQLFAMFPAFDFVLDRIERWDDGIVWLHPEPSQPFEDLTAAVWQRWPDYPPYGGTIDVVIPHLTVSETPIDAHVELPIASRARKVTLIEERPDQRWVIRRAFPLG